MLEREIVENLVIYILGTDQVYGKSIDSTVKLDEETLVNRSIKHMCSDNGILFDITFQKGTLRVLNNIMEVTIGVCPCCLKTYYRLLKVEEIDLTEYRQMIKATTQVSSITKQDLVQAVFNSNIEVLNIDYPNVTILETVFDPSSLSDEVIENNPNQELKENMKVGNISSWDEL